MWEQIVCLTSNANPTAVKAEYARVKSIWKPAPKAKDKYLVKLAFNVECN